MRNLQRNSALLLGICGFVFMVLLFPGVCGRVLAGQSTDAVARGVSVPGWVRDFPLWMGLRGKAFAVLDEGTVRQVRWGVYAFRGTGSFAGEKPCLELAMLSYGGGAGGASFQTNSSCGPLAPPAHRVVLVKNGFSMQKAVNGPTASATVFGMTLGPSVKEVRVGLRPNPAELRATRYVSARQARKAHVQRFRYVAFGIPRAACFEDLMGFDSLHNQVVHIQPERCE